MDVKLYKLPLGLRLLRLIPLPRKLGLIERVYGRKIQKAGVVWTKTFAGPIWKLDLKNHTHRWIVYGYYEGPDFIPWAKKWIKPDSVVVDSGSNIGQVLLYLAPMVCSGCWLAVEPHPVARKWLSDCLSKQDEWKVRLEGFGLGEKEGYCSMSQDWGGDSLGSHTCLQEGSGDIPVFSLDQYADNNRINKIRLWKLDMEGGEEAALRGAERLFQKKAIEAIVMETDGKRFLDVVEVMKKRGFACCTWQGKTLERVADNFFGNVLFLLK